MDCTKGVLVQLVITGRFVYRVLFFHRWPRRITLPVVLLISDLALGSVDSYWTGWQHATSACVKVAFGHRSFSNMLFLTMSVSEFPNCEERLSASSCPSGCMEQFCSHRTDFDEIWFKFFFENLSRNSSSFKSDKNNRYFTWRLFTFMAVRPWIGRMRNVLDKSCRIKAHIFIFSRKSHSLWDNVEKVWWRQRGHKWLYNLAHACCMLGKQGYTRALTLTNT